MGRPPRVAEDAESFDGDDLDGADGIDSGPSREDLERFSHEEAFCPECGAMVWDEAPICPKCGSMLADGPGRRPPLEAWWRSRWLVIIVVMLILSLAGLLPLLLR